MAFVQYLFAFANYRFFLKSTHSLYTSDVEASKSDGLEAKILDLASRFGLGVEHLGSINITADHKV